MTEGSLKLNDTEPDFPWSYTEITSTFPWHTA